MSSPRAPTAAPSTACAAARTPDGAAARAAVVAAAALLAAAAVDAAAAAALLALALTLLMTALAAALALAATLAALLISTLCRDAMLAVALGPPDATMGTTPAPAPDAAAAEAEAASWETRELMVAAGTLETLLAGATAEEEDGHEADWGRPETWPRLQIVFANWIVAVQVVETC